MHKRNCFPKRDLVGKLSKMQESAAKAKMEALTFKDVWEAKGTNASIVAHFHALGIDDLSLSDYFSINTGKRLPEMEEFFNAILVPFQPRF